MINPVVIGAAILYHGDCREILPSLHGYDVVMTDPVWPNCPSGLIQGAEAPYELFSQMWQAVIASPVRAVIVMRSDSDPRFFGWHAS